MTLLQVPLAQLSSQSAPASHVTVGQPAALLSQSIVHSEPSWQIISTPVQSLPLFSQITEHVCPLSHTIGSTVEQVPPLEHVRLQEEPGRHSTP